MPLIELTDEEARDLALERNFSTLSKKQIAQAFHVGVRTITEWVSRGCPRNKDGTYRCADVGQWLIDRAFEKRRRATLGACPHHPNGCPADAHPIDFEAIGQ